jgi:glycosyltransferase involved in cell wall biosynthesis
MFLTSCSIDATSAPTGWSGAAGVHDSAETRSGDSHNEYRPSHQHCKIMVLMPLSVQLGGGELMFLDLIEHGRNLNVEWLVVFTSDGPMVQTVRDWGVEALVIPAGRLRQPHRIASTVMKIRRLMKQKRIDAVISWIAKTHLYGGLAAALAGIPAVWYQLGLPDPPKFQERIATAVPARGILTCSDSAKRAQQKVWPYRVVHTVHPGVSLDRFNPDTLPSPLECRRQLGLPIQGALIGIVGRLQRWKGMHYLIDAMPAILRQHADAHCVIVGGQHAFEPQYPALLRQRVADANLTQHVTFAGLQHNIPHWMQAMDVVIHASDNEPFGMVVIEAMALGKPVAATDIAGPTEIISPGIDGSLWTAGDSASLSSAVLKFLADRDLRNRIGQAARSKAAGYSVKNYARCVVEHILELISAPARKAPL